MKLTRTFLLATCTTFALATSSQPSKTAGRHEWHHPPDEMIEHGWFFKKPNSPPSSHQPTATLSSEYQATTGRAEDHRFNARELTGHPHAIVLTDDDITPVNVKRRGAPPTPGIYGCCLPHFRGTECLWKPAMPNACMNYDCIQGPNFGSSLGPDKGVSCELFAEKDCKGVSIKDFRYGRPEAQDTGSPFWTGKGFTKGVASFKCATV